MNLRSRNLQPAAQKCCHAKISPSTKLAYLNCFTANVEHLMIIEGPLCPLLKVDEGAQILIGNNTYVVVYDFRTTSDEIAQVIGLAKQQQTKKLMLSQGQCVIQSNGLPVTLAAPVEVSIPEDCRITLPAHTKLQQVGFPIQLELCEAVDAILY
jgi:hypothetical protein